MPTCVIRGEVSRMIFPSCTRNLVWSRRFSLFQAIVRRSATGQFLYYYDLVLIRVNTMFPAVILSRFYRNPDTRLIRLDVLQERNGRDAYLKPLLGSRFRIFGRFLEHQYACLQRRILLLCSSVPLLADRLSVHQGMHLLLDHLNLRHTKKRSSAFRATHRS